MMMKRNYFIGPVITILLGSLVAACNTSGSNVESALGTAGQETAMSSQQNDLVVDTVQDPRAYCPKSIMRAGTETFNVYPQGVKADDPDKAGKLRFRATITEVVRECNSAGQMLNIRVGIAGRILSGPSGESGAFNMPVRVAVTRGEDVLYSQLHEVSVEIPTGRTNNTFSYVDGNIVIPKPDKENILIYAGFDEQQVDIPGASQAESSLRPVN
jgi:hypothetical protein